MPAVDLRFEGRLNSTSPYVPVQQIPADVLGILLRFNVPSILLGSREPPNPLWNPKAKSDPATGTGSPTTSGPSSPRGRSATGSPCPAVVAAAEALQVAQAGVSPLTDVPRDHQADRAILEAKLKSESMVRDRGCVITGLPISSGLVAAHVLTPPYAEEYVSDLKCFRFFRRCPEATFHLTKEPVVDQVGIGPTYTPTYDVANAIILDEKIHTFYDNFYFSIMKMLPYSTPIYEDYFVKRFPHKSLFHEHFVETLKRNLHGMAEAKFEDEDDDDGEVYAGMSAEDTALNKAWGSLDTLVDENFLLSA
ncbi:hypothetical protein HDV00_004452 [Rhizophlyctis rosea]|nr:hypothetical protein HDV00_004452 [Rhizophlyctis rosea]